MGQENKRVESGRGRDNNRKFAYAANDTRSFRRLLSTKGEQRAKFGTVRLRLRLLSSDDKTL